MMSACPTLSSREHGGLTHVAISISEHPLSLSFLAAPSYRHRAARSPFEIR